MYDNWLNNIDEAVKATANLIKELIDVRNGDKCVPIVYNTRIVWPDVEELDRYFFVLSTFLFLFF